MSKKQYIYDYPEQRELSKGLITGELSFIASKTNYSLAAISFMVHGKRKMAESVRNMIIKISSFKEELENME